MTSEYLEKQLKTYQSVLLVCAGAAVTLLATAAGDFPNRPNPFFPGWFAVWFCLELAVVVPPLVLLLGSEFRQLALAERLNTIFGFWAAAWLGLAAGGLKLAGLLGNGLSQPAIWVGGIGIVMAGAYWLLRRKHIDAPAALFP